MTEVELGGPLDGDILAEARRHRRCVVTLDFGTLLARSGRARMRVSYDSTSTCSRVSAERTRSVHRSRCRASAVEIRAMVASGRSPQRTPSRRISVRRWPSLRRGPSPAPGRARVVAAVQALLQAALESSPLSLLP